MAVIATLTKGCDLDYIWRQVDSSLTKDAAGYYIQASEGGGEPPGRWWGPGAQALGLEPGRIVEREPYDLLFGEHKAPDGTQLGRPPGSGRKAADIYARLMAAEPHATAERKRELRLEAVRQARQSPLYFDLTLSLSKSISIFHASLGENARLARQARDVAGDEYWSGLVAEVDEMIWQAVWAGFGYFQQEAGYTRTGSHNSRVHSVTGALDGARQGYRTARSELGEAVPPHAVDAALAAYRDEGRRLAAAVKGIEMVERARRGEL